MIVYAHDVLGHQRAPLRGEIGTQAHAIQWEKATCACHLILQESAHAAFKLNILYKKQVDLIFGCAGEKYKKARGGFGGARCVVTREFDIH